MCNNVACHQHFAENGKQWLVDRVAALRRAAVGHVEGEQDEDPNLILDVFDVDQHGRLLVDVRGTKLGSQTTMLQRWTFARECVAAGWAHTTPFHVLPDCVHAAATVARRENVGAWGLQTDEQPFQG